MTEIERFCKHYFDLQQLSHNRRLEVTRVLRKLAKWAKNPGDLSSLDANDLSEWMADMVREGISPSSARTYLAAVKPFYKWLATQGTIDAPTLMAITALHPPRGAEVNAVPRPYSRAEIKRLWADLEAAYPFTTEKHLARVRKGTSRYTERAYKHGMRLQLDAIISIALFMGLRRKEIYTLTLDALHPDNAYVVVEGKREDHRPKVREVPYPEAVRETVIAWFKWRRWLNPPHEQVWLSLAYNSRDRPMSFTRFASILTTVGPGWELHRLRHTCATERLRAGMPIEKLQPFLGHANIEQTLLYTKIETSDIIAAAEKSDADFMRAIGRRKAAA